LIKKEKIMSHKLQDYKIERGEEEARQGEVKAYCSSRVKNFTTEFLTNK
jgi:hypothetical protein